MTKPQTWMITGAASGIGRATAALLAREGAARLILIDRDADALGALDLPCAVERIAGDVRDEALWARAEPLLAGIDGAVIAAGVAGASPIAETSLEEWRRVTSINLDGAFLALRAAMRAMAGPGAIVLVSSVAGSKPEPGTGAYAASKAAVSQLARVAAKEGAARRIRVNAIAPGGVDTPIWDAMPFFVDLVREKGGRDAAIAAMADMATPLGRYATADEIAAQIAFLLSDAAATITGTVLVSDGGYSL